jgi:hypothetical protein
MPADDLPLYPQAAKVELTPLGFRIRKGSGNLGAGVWAARWKAEKAAEALRAGGMIPAEYLADRRVDREAV